MIWTVLVGIALLLCSMGAFHSLSKNKLTGVFVSCAAVALVIVSSGLYVAPVYNVWQQELEGKAALAKSVQDRQIIVNEAKAKEQSATHWANAEVERAKGAAKANSIVADSLGGSEGYLRWLFIEKLDEIQSGQIIYLPTEAGIPILEAGKSYGPR